MPYQIPLTTLYLTCFGVILPEDATIWTHPFSFTAETNSRRQQITVERGAFPVQYTIPATWWMTQSVLVTIQSMWSWRACPLILTSCFLPWVHGIHQTSPNTKIPVCASSMPKNPPNSSAATRCRMQLTPRPLSCAVCQRLTGCGTFSVYVLHPQETRRITLHYNRQLAGSFYKDCVSELAKWPLQTNLLAYLGRVVLLSWSKKAHIYVIIIHDFVLLDFLLVTI